MYEASGQKINRNKTTLFFSKCTPRETKHEIKVAFGVPKIMQYEKYLGLPSFMGKKRKASFNYIKEKIWRKLQVGVFAVWCGGVLGHFQHCILWCDLAKTITVPHLNFVVTCAEQYIKYGLHGLKSVYFSNFGFFLPSQKLFFFFPLFWAKF